MEHSRFRRWCERACAGVRYSPDRARVRAELYAHMEDAFDALVAAGRSPDEAERAVLEEMGDAGETAALLERVHRPFWGYCLRAARWILAVSLALAALAAGWRLTHWEYGGDDAFGEAVFQSERRVQAEEVYTRTRVFSPMAQDRSDGYTFTLTRAAEWHWSGEIDGKRAETDSFFLRAEVFSPLPWAEESEVLREFYAVDSLGNVYAPFRLSLHSGDRALVGNPSRRKPFTVTWDMWLEGYCSQQAEWIELRYDKAGRDVRLRVDLTGGGAE